MKTKEIVEGALVSAIICAFMLVNLQLGGILGYVIFLLPLPLMYFTFKYGFKHGLVPLFSSVILVFMFSSLTLSLITFLQSALGIVYGEGLRKKESSTILLLKTILFSISIQLISTVLLSKLFGYDINDDIDMLVQTMSLLDLKLATGLDFTRLIKIFVFAAIPLNGIFEGYLTHYFSRLLLIRLRFQIEKPKTIVEYNPPSYTGYIAIVFACLFFVVVNKDIFSENVQYILVFLGILSVTYLIIFGSIALILFLKTIIPNAKIAIFLITLFGIFIFNVTIIMIGFLYITTNLRKTLLKRLIDAS